MIALASLLLVTLASPSLEQGTPLSPCPNVFMYETSGTEPGRWYGVVNLSTDSTLHSLWLNIVLDSKADILGNWVGDVTTTDNTDFKIENTKMKIHPGPATAVRFFVQYNPLNKPPRLQAIRLNGREICNANNGLPAVDRRDERPSRPEERPSRPETTARPTSKPRPRPEDSRPEVRPRPEETRPRPRPDDSDIIVRPSVRPEDSLSTKPVYGRPSGDGPVYVPTPNPDMGNANPYSINEGQVPSQNVGTQTRPDRNRPTRPDNGYQATPSSPLRPTTQRRRDEDDFDSSDGHGDGDYFTGGQPTFIVPAPGSGSGSSNHFSHDGSRPQQECGKVVRNNPNPLVVNGKPTLEGQWPWQIALYQTQTVDNKYICGGTLVSKQHVVTAAHCVTRKGSSRLVNKNTLTVYLGKHNLRTSVEGVQIRLTVDNKYICGGTLVSKQHVVTAAHCVTRKGSSRLVNKNTLTVYLGKHNLRTSVEGVQIRLVGEIIVHPQYNASSFSHDLGILKLREPVSFSDWVRPACLWPENELDLNNVIGKKGAVVGWGFDDTGVATEELTLVEMPVVDQETCIRSYSEFFARFTSEFTFCAGYRDGTSVCNGDSGGGMVFNLRGSWYLRGLVSLSVARQNEYRCDPSHYVVFTDLAKFLTWIKQNIGY